MPACFYGSVMTEFGLAVLFLFNDRLLLFCVVGSYDRSGRSDKLIKGLAVQCVNCCLNTAVAHVVAVNSNSHGLLTCKDCIECCNIAATANEDGVLVSRIGSCCTCSADGHVVIIADNDRNTLRMALDDRFHCGYSFVGYTVSVLGLRIQISAASLFNAFLVAAHACFGGGIAPVHPQYQLR